MWNPRPCTKPFEGCGVALALFTVFIRKKVGSIIFVFLVDLTYSVPLAKASKKQKRQ